jgi:hypothetical protein
MTRAALLAYEVIREHEEYTETALVAGAKMA